MKTVIINSIGTAKPYVVKVIADTLGLAEELMFKLIYQAPNVLFHEITDDLAEKSLEMLTALGLIAKIQDSKIELPKRTDMVDVAVYLPEAIKIGLVAGQLADFLGCDSNQALNLMLNEPSIVLGDVSIATAEALSNRIDAEVVVSNPKKDMYFVNIKNNDSIFRKRLEKNFDDLKIIYTKGVNIIENLSFEQSQSIWRSFNNPNDIEIKNQSFQRFEVLLEKFDLLNSSQTDFLKNEIGMPESILQEIHPNLPIILHESLNKKDLAEFVSKSKSSGLEISFNLVPSGKFNLSIDQINDKTKTKAVLDQFFNDVKLQEHESNWVSPKPLQSLLARCISEQLEQIGCNVQFQIA